MQGKANLGALKQCTNLFFSLPVPVPHTQRAGCTATLGAVSSPSYHRPKDTTFLLGQAGLKFPL